MLRVTLSAILVLTTSCALAQNEVSKTYLGRVNQLLKNTHVLIAKAKAFDNKTLRYRFDYKKLDADIAKVEEGISDYINSRQIDPREIKPLHGQYGEGV